MTAENFIKKKIMGAETTGEIFKTYRLGLDLRIEKISAKIGVSKEYLEALENNDYATIPGLVYGKNFIRSYASYMGLDARLMEKKFIKEYKIFEKVRDKGNIPFKRYIINVYWIWAFCRHCSRSFWS